MSDRWKAVERGAAAQLNSALSDVGKYSPIERIPILGRTGPDLTVNETGLVIDVKSRGRIPKRLFPTSGHIHMIGSMACFRLEDLSQVPEMPICASTPSWKDLTGWWTHMDEWTRDHEPRGITTILIHRPRMPIGHIGIVLHIKDLRRLSCQLKTQQSN
ncbi:MAG: hypothetical protein ACM3XO_12735 [Bacteroidota bacterium]